MRDPISTYKDHHPDIDAVIGVPCKEIFQIANTYCRCNISTDTSLMSNVSPIACHTQVEQPGTTTHPDLHVLLVDDDARYLILCERYLARSAKGLFIVDTANTVEKALACCSANRYDCLIVDYELPDGTGTDFIHSLKKHTDKTPPPTIITTADGGEDAAIKAIRAGAADFISKRNVSSQAISRSIHNAVDKHTLSESLKDRNAELVLANNSLESKRLEIQQFYLTVSHEVKTPLAAAREFVSLVKDGAEGQVSDGQDQLLQLAIDSCDQINKQFTELLDLARLESGKLELKYSNSSIDGLVSRSISAVSALARDRNITLHLDCAKGIKVVADPDRLVQVLSNLLHNAVKFSEDGGEVVLRTTLFAGGTRLKIGVHDQGCGISQEDQNSIFDRLYQCEDQLTKSSENGLGLGLAIAKDIVALHGEELRVTSKLNTGSTFSFELPIESH